MKGDDNHWRHVQILEAFWSMDAGKKFIQYHYNELQENDKINLLRIIENYKKEEELQWIAGQLTDFAAFKDFNRKTALQFLLYRGDINALNYVISNYEPKDLEMNYPYNYSQPEATDGILFLFHKVVEDEGNIEPNCYNSLRQSIINISINSKEKRKQILDDMKAIAGSDEKRSWLFNEIERIEEELLKRDDDHKTFKEVLTSVPLFSH